MGSIVECVPNFSEGRRPEVVAAIADEISGVPGVKLLDTTRDPDHNRSVITFAGRARAVKEAAFRACAKATELIDMSVHRGVHPRIGATDVIPFIPLKGVSVDECVILAKGLARRIATVLGIPVYLYGEAAQRPDRRALPEIRRGNLERLRAEISSPERHPDFGEARLHPTAGATAVGVRKILVAFNVELETGDVEIAREIARRVRESGGGLSNVRAIGVPLESRGTAQVSMNILDYEATPIYRAFELVKAEARRLGTTVTSSELIGLVPEDALVDSAEYYLGLKGWSRSRTLERSLRGLR